VAKARAKPKPKPRPKAKAAPKAKARRAPKPRTKRAAKPPRAPKPARQLAYRLVPIHEDDTGFARGSQVMPVVTFETPKPVPEPAPWSTRVETPFAERAAGAGVCAHCGGKIKRAEWQVVVTDDGATIHPGCAFAWTHEHLEDSDADDWMAALVEHLSEADRAELLSQLTPR